MKLKELKKFLNSLTKEQLEQVATFYPEESSPIEINLAYELEEDLYYDPESPGDGECRSVDDIDIEGFEDYEIGFPKGTIMIA